MNKPSDLESWVIFLLVAFALVMILIFTALAGLAQLSFTHRPVDVYYTKYSEAYTWWDWLCLVHIYPGGATLRLFGLTLLLEPRNKIK